MSKRTVKDFPQEYFGIWQLALQGRLDLRMPSKGHATNKKVDLQIFRKRLAEEDPQLANEFYQVDLLATGDNTFGFLTGYIPEWKKQVREQLAQTNLTSAEVVEVAKDIVAEQEQASQDALGDTLKNMGFKAPNT